MKQNIQVSELNSVLVPDAHGPFIATADVQFVDGVKMATVSWAGKMMGRLTFNANNFLISIQVLDEPNDTPAVRASLENIATVL